MLLNKANLQIADLASKDESRYTLTGIAITQRETVVTDGHRLMRVTLPDQSMTKHWPVGDSGFNPAHSPNGEPWLLEADEAKRLLKGAAKKTTIPILCHVAVTRDESKGEIVAQAGELPMTTYRSKAITGQFPKWAECFPDGEPLASVTVDAKLLAEMLRTILAMGTKSVQLRMYGSGKPIRIDADLDDSNQIVQAILMPMRGDVKAAGMKPTDVVEAVQAK